jgi:hypothetical protein
LQVCEKIEIISIKTPSSGPVDADVDDPVVDQQ